MYTWTARKKRKRELEWYRDGIEMRKKAHTNRNRELFITICWRFVNAVRFCLFNVVAFLSLALSVFYSIDCWLNIRVKMHDSLYYNHCAHQIYIKYSAIYILIIIKLTVLLMLWHSSFCFHQNLLYFVVILLLDY